MKRPSLAVARTFGLAVLFVQLACSVHAGTWVWVDDAGHKVYSDIPPPSHLSDKRILQQPGKAKSGGNATPQEAASPLPPASSSSTAPKVQSAKPGSGTPADPAALKKQQDAQKAAELERKAQDEKRAQVRAENCRRARSSLATLESGVRLVTTNEQGQQVVLDDTLRAQEKAQMQAAVQENCD